MHASRIWSANLRRTTESVLPVLLKSLIWHFMWDYCLLMIMIALTWQESLRKCSLCGRLPEGTHWEDDTHLKTVGGDDDPLPMTHQIRWLWWCICFRGQAVQGFKWFYLEHCLKTIYSSSRRSPGRGRCCCIRHVDLIMVRATRSQRKIRGCLWTPSILA